MLPLLTTALDICSQIMLMFLDNIRLWKATIKVPFMPLIITELEDISDGRDYEDCDNTTKWQPKQIIKVCSCFRWNFTFVLNFDKFLYSNAYQLTFYKTISYSSWCIGSIFYVKRVAYTETQFPIILQNINNTQRWFLL